MNRPLLIDLATGLVGPASVNGHGLTLPAGARLTDFNSLGDARWVQLANLNTLGDARWSAIGHTHSFASLTGKPTTIAGYGITDFNSLGDARWQPLDSDLTALAALATDPFGRALLTKADAASIRTYIGAGTSSFDGTFTSLTGKPTTIAGYGITDFNSLGDARWQPLDSDLTTWAGITPASGIGTFLATPTLVNLKAAVTDETTVGWNLLTLANPSAVTFIKIAADNTVTAESAATYRSSLGATTVGGNLFTLANPGAITFLQFNADNTVTAQSASAQRTALGLSIGTNVQAWDADLDTWAGITPASGVGTFLATPTLVNLKAAVTDETTAGWNLLTLANPGAITFIKIAADNTVSAESGATHRTSLGLAIGTNVQAWDADLDTWATITPATGVGTFLATPTLVNLKAAVTDETTVGWNLLTLANPGAITFLQLNADNTVTAQSASAQRTALGLAIGTNVQAWDADLDTWAGITPATGVGTFLATPTLVNLKAAVTDETTVGWNLLTLANPGAITFLQLNADNTVTAQSASAQRTALSLVPGTDIVAFNGALGTPTSGSAANLTSFPTLNQNTTGSAASLSISGQTGLLTFTGLASTNRAKTVRDAADTILELGGSYTPTGTWTNLTLVTPALGTPASGVVTNLTGTASININGTVGGTTPAAGIFTTLVAGSTTSLLLGTAGTAVGNIGFRNATSGTATLAPPTGALGTFTVTLPNAASTLPIFGQQITFAGPTAARTVTFPDASFTVARTDAANTFTGVQTMTSAALTTPAIAGGTATGLTGLAIRDTSAAFDVTIAGTSSTTLTAGRTLTLDMGNVAHTLAFGTTANTITFPNVASDTVVMLAASQTLTNKTLTSPTFTAPVLGTPASGALTNCTSIPVANATGTLAVANGGTGDTGTAWTTYTPTVTSGSGTITTLGTVTGRYKQIGKTVFVQMDISITTNGTAATEIRATLPVAAVGSVYQLLAAREYAINGKFAYGFIDFANGKAGIRNVDNTYPGADGAKFVVQGVYEAA